MITKDNLPLSYKPFQNLRLCGNEIIGGANIFGIGEVLPLLIGSGEEALVWLQIPIASKSPKNRKFFTVVEASIPKHQAFKVLSDGDFLTVSLGGDILVRVKVLSPDSAEVDKLDLRPVGMNLFGDSHQLQVGGMTLSSNTFQNVGTAIALS